MYWPRKRHSARRIRHTSDMSSKVRNTVAENVRSLRGSESQQALGRRAGISQRAIGNLEAMVKAPTVDTIEKLAVALRVEPWALLMPCGDVELLRSAGLQRLVVTYAAIPGEGRKQIERVAEAEARYSSAQPRSTLDRF